MRVDRQERYLAAWLNAKPIRQYSALCYETAEDKASARAKALSDGVIGCGDIGERCLGFGGVHHLRGRKQQGVLWSVLRAPYAYCAAPAAHQKTAQERQ
jgi:hypothetical protein